MTNEIDCPDVAQNDESLETWMRPGDHPKELILDPESGLEVFFTGLGCGSLLLTFASIEVLLKAFGGWAAVTSVCVGLGVAILAYILRKGLDDHYRIDFSARTVSCYRKFFSSVSRRTICDFSKLHALVVDGEEKSNKTDGRWWDYGLLLVLKDGHRIQLTDRDQKEFDLALQRAKTLATMMAVPLHPGEEKTSYQVVHTGVGVQIEAKPKSKSPLVGAILTILLLVMGVGIAVYLGV